MAKMLTILRTWTCEHNAVNTIPEAGAAELCGECPAAGVIAATECACGRDSVYATDVNGAAIREVCEACEAATFAKIEEEAAADALAEWAA